MISSARLTCCSSRISGLYNVQQTLLRSEQTLKRSAESGWNTPNIPFSRMEIRRSVNGQCIRYTLWPKRTFEDNPYDPFLLLGRTLLVDLPKDGQILRLLHSPSSQLVEECIDGFDGQLTHFHGRPLFNFFEAHSGKIAGAVMLSFSINGGFGQDVCKLDRLTSPATGCFHFVNLMAEGECLSRPSTSM